MLNVVRRKVSLNKRRLQEDGFDLDLTYITPQVIAMGFPASGSESLYRNPRGEVIRFLESRHSSNYKVYNLCVEEKWTYPPQTFHGRVARYPFADHQAPPLELMSDFCSDVAEWLGSDSSHLAAIHCKAGKGRAGMMISCWLIHSQFAPTADEAMLKYGNLRTKDGKGVTIPSQRRYVRYYEDIYYYGLPTPPTIKLESLRVKVSSYVKGYPAFPSLVILNRAGEELFKSAPQAVISGDYVVEFGGLELTGDIKVLVFDRSIKKKKESCALWFNTSFVDGNSLVVKKQEVDKVFKDKKCRLYKPDFEISMKFSDAEESAMTKLKQKGKIRESSGKKKTKKKASKKGKEGKKEKSKENSEKTEKSPEKSEKVSEKKSEKGKEKVEEKVKEKSNGKKVSEKSEKKSPEEKATEKVKEKSKEKVKEKSEEKVKEDSKEKSAEKAKEKSDKPQEKVKEDSKEKSKEKVKEKAEEKSKEKVEEKSVEKVKEKSNDKVKEKSEKIPIEEAKVSPKEELPKAEKKSKKKIVESSSESSSDSSPEISESSSSSESD